MAAVMSTSALSTSNGLISCAERLSNNAAPRASVSFMPVARSSFRGSRLQTTGTSAVAVRSRSSIVRASEEVTPAAGVDTEKLISDLKAKWDKVENKPTVLLYAGGAVVVVWISSAVVGAISSVPLLPKFLELVGVGYTGWFVYRYLLFKSSRKELASELDELKNKITGATGLDE